MRSRGSAAYFCRASRANADQRLQQACPESARLCDSVFSRLFAVAGSHWAFVIMHEADR